MEYTVAKRGWCLLNDRNKVMAEGNKADIEKVVFGKILEGHTVKGVEHELHDDQPELTDD